MTPDAGRDRPADTVRVGRLGRTHGLDGALRLHLDDPALADALHDGDRVHVDGHGALRLRLLRPHGRTLLVAFQGVRTPERARALVNADLSVEADAVPADARAAVAAAVTRGADVVVDGRPFGRVASIVRGPQVLIEVRPDDRPNRTVWLPAAAPYVTVSDGRVEVHDAPPGLLDDEA